MTVSQKNRSHNDHKAGSAARSLRLILGTIFALQMLTGASAPQVWAQPGAGKPVLDNQRVRIWDMTLTPGKPVLIGHLENDAVTLYYTGGKIRSTDADGKTSVAVRQFGDAVYVPKGDAITDEVMSQNPARVFVIELKDDPVPPLVNKSGYPLAFPRPGSIKVFENNRIIMWKYVYKIGVPTPTHFHDKDTVVLYRYDGSIQSTTPDGKSQVSDDRAGTVRFRKGNRVHFEQLVKGQETIIATELK